MAAKKTSKKGAEKAPKKVRTPSVRQERLIEGVLQGKSKRRAALDAGYSENTANVKVYGMLEKDSIQQRIRERIREAQIDTNEVIGTLVSQMRGDFGDILLDNEFVQKIKALGLSHLLKEVEITERSIMGEEGEAGILERKYKIKIHDAQSAAKHLCNVFGLEKLPAPNPETLRRLDEAVDRFIEKAARKGIAVTPEQARAKLMPFIQSQTVQ